MFKQKQKRRETEAVVYSKRGTRVSSIFLPIDQAALKVRIEITYMLGCVMLCVYIYI